MPTQYQKGVAFERELVSLFKTVGCYSWRSAGSHGPYDVMVLGSFDQVQAGYDKLFTLLGFEATEFGFHRAKGKYLDTGYCAEFKSWKWEQDNKMVLLIQCKRKEKK